MIIYCISIHNSISELSRGVAIECVPEKNCQQVAGVIFAENHKSKAETKKEGNPSFFTLFQVY